MKGISILTAICFSIAVPAGATGAARTFVSATGLDTNPCTRSSPCRGFTAALAQTAPAGSILVLDSAGYGTLTIGQSVSIVAPDGVYAGIAAPTGNAVSITGTTSADKVRLRGLSIEGSGTASTGIFLYAQALGELHLERCIVTGFVDLAIDFEPNTNADLFMSDTALLASNYGLYAGPGNNSKAFLSVDHCRLIGNNSGASLQNGVAATLTNSVVSGNAGGGIITNGVIGVTSVDRCQITNNSEGIHCFSGNTTVTNSVVSQSPIGILGANNGTKVTVDYCQVSGNAVGIQADNLAAIYVSNSTVSGNSTGLAATNSGSLLNRIGDATYPVKTNTVVSNGADGAFTGTFTAQ